MLAHVVPFYELLLSVADVPAMGSFPSTRMIPNAPPDLRHLCFVFASDVSRDAFVVELERRLALDNSAAQAAKVGEMVQVRNDIGMTMIYWPGLIVKEQPK